ncbi:unnamed protein product [Camellia sinensis]
MIRDFPHYFKAYVKNHQLLCQRGDFNDGWVFCSREDDRCELPLPSTLFALISLDYEFDVDGVSDKHLGLLGRVFRHQQRESTTNVQYYSCNEYPQRDRAIVCNIKQSLAIPFFESSGPCCIGVLEMVSTTEITNSIDIGARFFMEKDMDETLKEIKNMLEVLYIEDNVYVVEFFLPPNYTEDGDPRIALVPLLTTMKQHLKSFKVAFGEELGEELSIEVLDFSENGKLYSYQMPQTASSPNRMENGEEMVWVDLSNQQLLEVDAIDSGSNVVSNTGENNIAVTSIQQNCIINLSQRLQRKAGIPINLEDLQQRFGMKLKDAAKSLGVSRSTIKRACREYNITWWSPRKRSKDNHSLSNKLVQGAVQEQIQELSQPPISDPPCKQDMATASRTKPHFMAEQDTSTVTIKAKYGDDFIKFQLLVLSGMVEFQQHVAKRLNLQGGTYRAKYQDEDNDWILIACDEDLQNYICNSISQGRNTVTMSLEYANGQPILRVSRGVVLGFGCFMGLLKVILNKAGVSLG